MDSHNSMRPVAPRLVEHLPARRAALTEAPRPAAHAARRAAEEGARPVRLDGDPVSAAPGRIPRIRTAPRVRMTPRNVRRLAPAVWPKRSRDRAGLRLSLRT